MDIKLFILAFILGAYYFVHSFFLHPPVKRYFIERLFFSYRAYRIVFNVFATLGLLVVYWYSKEIDSTIWVDELWLKIIGVITVIVGLYITYKSFENYDTREFLGITAESIDTLQNDLVVDGYHKFVRHPVYFATIVIFIGYFLYAPGWVSLVFLSVTFFYLQIGIFLEENKLIFKFGENYKDYKKRVPKLFPWFNKKN